MEILIKIKDKTFYSVEEFARNIYLYPDDSFAMIKSQKFLKILYKYDEKMYNDIVVALQAPFQQDELLFRIQYILNPLMGIRHHGYLFEDFISLGKQIIAYGPSVDIYLKDFLKYRLLTYYMVKTRYDEKEPLLYKEVMKLEEEFKVNENRAYFKLGFLLNDSKAISYNNKKFVNPKEFLSYVMLPVNITGFGKSFIQSQYVFAWLDYLGYKKEIILFENLVDSVTKKERENDNIRKV